jgi:hypothetical protein
MKDKKDIIYRLGDDVHNAAINKTGNVREDKGSSVLVRYSGGLDEWDKSNIELIPPEDEFAP